MKISLLCPFLSNNCLGRAFVLAKVLARRYDVEVVGPVSEEGIWEPLRQESLSYKAVVSKHGLNSIGTMRSLLTEATGDVIYASKPLLPSFGIGLLRKFQSRVPLVLDIDDWELGAYLSLGALDRLKLVYNLNTGRLDAYYPFIWLMYRLIRYADSITVSSRFLQNKHGGVVVPHGRDTVSFDPARFDGLGLRKQYGLAGTVVMFLGTLRPRKGVEDLINAVKLLARNDILTVIAGVNWSSPFTKRLARLGGDRTRLFGMQPFSEIPAFLAMADVVVIPQRLENFTIAQVPAKIFDAMAMAKPIVATNVSDIPLILSDGCGIVVEPQNIEQLAEAINWVLENENEAREMGARAREKCVKDYSWNAMEEILIKVFAQYE